MAVYDIWTDVFAWKKTIYGAGTIVVFSDDLIRKYRYNGLKISQRGIFKNTYIANDGTKMYQFEKYITEYINNENDYAICFSLTELQLINAIKGIGPRPVVVTQMEPVVLSHVCDKSDVHDNSPIWFFEYNNLQYSKKTEMYLSDDFILQFYKKYNIHVTKKVSFSFRQFDIHENKMFYYVINNPDMIPENHNKTDYDTIVKLTENEFYNGLEVIVKPYSMGSDIKFGLLEVMLVALYIMLIKLNFIIFVSPSAGIVVSTVLVWKIYKTKLKTGVSNDCQNI